MSAAHTEACSPEAKARGPIGWAEMGLLPDRAIRAGIRRLNRQRLEEIGADDPESAAADLGAFLDRMHDAPIAPVPERANAQHYELPAAFFAEILGRNRKYSCCYWAPDTQLLDDAEADALRITCEHAGIEDGMDVLDLGCGWGSLSLWIAALYPGCRITAVSNSSSQREYIVARAAERGIENLAVTTCDMNAFDPGKRFDRIVSVEMFEHMRNYPELLYSKRSRLG